MKIHQNVRHFATRKALELPVLGDIAHDKMVDLHMKVFLGWADPEHTEARRAHLESFFDATMDTYLTALQEGAPEAEAREITHIQANFDFANHGWTEMMEFPVEEVDAHYDRYREFFERHDITTEDPLGEFAPDELPDAPETPEKLENPEYPHAEGGFADDVYVQDEEGAVQAGGQDEPEDVDVTESPAVDEEDVGA